MGAQLGDMCSSLVVYVNVSDKQVDRICEWIALYTLWHFESKYNNLPLIKPLETILIRKPASLDMYEQYVIEIYIYYTYVVHVFVQLALQLQYYSLAPLALE